MYFKKEQIEKNVNSEYGLNRQVQKTLTNGNAEFIILLSRQMKISYTIPSLALHISQIFFQKKSYLFYDRFIFLTAAFVLASKIKDIECRLKTVCNSYYNIISRITMNYEPFNEEKMKNIHDEVCVAETEILRTLEYKVDFVTPHDYLKRHVQNLGQPKQTIKKVFGYSRILIIDSFRTQCCLLFNPLVICASALLIACRYQGFRPYLCDSIKYELQAKKRKLKNCEQGEIVGSNTQANAAVEQDKNAEQIAQVQRDQFKHEELYECWLSSMSEKEGQPLDKKEVLQCIAMMNQILIFGIDNQMP